MSKERIIKALVGLGFTHLDAQIYIFLAKEGPHKVREIVLSLNFQDETIRNSLHELQELNIVKPSIENPLEYIAVPFEEVLDLFIEVKKEQAKTMEETKGELLSQWKAVIKKKS